MMRDQFFRGARIGRNRVLETARAAQGGEPLTLGQIVFVLVSVQDQHYKELKKEDLLRLVDKAYDAYRVVKEDTPDQTPERDMFYGPRHR